MGSVGARIEASLQGSLCEQVQVHDSGSMAATLWHWPLKVRKAWRMTILALPLFCTMPFAMSPAAGGTSADSTRCHRESFAAALRSRGPCTANHACKASHSLNLDCWLVLKHKDSACTMCTR